MVATGEPSKKCCNSGVAPPASTRVRVRTNSRDFQRFLWYGPALVRSVRSRTAAQLAAALLVVTLGVSAAAAARPGAAARRDARVSDTRVHRALLDLYALDTRLQAARARVSSLEAQIEQLRGEQATLTLQLTATQRTLAVSQQRLEQNLSLLYKQGDVNTVAVVLGATSLNDALTRLDDLDRVAAQSRQFVAVSTRARTRLARLRTSLVQRRAEADAAMAGARRTATELAVARAARASFVTRLRREAELRHAQLHAVETSAAKAARTSVTLQAAAAPAPAPAGAGTLTVTTTGYSLPGRTATGLAVGPGVVAVDPAVIPLGTHLTIPGYGEAVAADVGSGVRGAMIDLWFPTLAQARAWGRRSVTITLH